MNLLQIQDALKNASDQQLVQLVQSPDSTAPSYLVLSELKRRKEMRAQQQQEPQGTVAEDLAKETTYDDQGIRSLRMPGYEEEAKPAEDDGAGIEAMREGGVVRMAGGDLVEGGPLLESTQEAIDRANQTGDREDTLFELLRPRFMPRPYRAPTAEPAQGGEQAPPAEASPLGAANPDGTLPIPPAPPGVGGAGAAGAAGSTGAAAGRAGAVGSAGGIGAMRSAAPNYDQMYERNLQRFPGLPADLEERMKAMRTDPAARRNEALNMSLIEAGLRIAASNNPRLAGAIGEGATPAVQAYSQQLGQIRQDQRADIKDELSVAQNNLARAYYAGQITATQFRTAMADIASQRQEGSAAARAAASERAAELRHQNTMSAEAERSRRQLEIQANTAATRMMSDIGATTAARSAIIAGRQAANPNNTDRTVTDDQLLDYFTNRILRTQQAIRQGNQQGPVIRQYNLQTNDLSN